MSLNRGVITGQELEMVCFSQEDICVLYTNYQ